MKEDMMATFAKTFKLLRTFISNSFGIWVPLFIYLIGLIFFI
jgi:hypothetical protein